MAPADHLEWDDVFKEELPEVTKRHTGEKPVEKNLVGLALSGGGIRSATFGLGVLETLKRLGLLKQIDYLSTVSGGGYIGAWLSANCKRTAERSGSDAETDWLEPGADWGRSIAHLRRYSNYLSPKLGFFSADTWSMGAIWIRNTLLVQMTVIFAIAAVLLLPRLLFGLFDMWPSKGDLRWLSVAFFILAVVGISANQLRLNQTHLRFLRASSWKRGAIFTLVFFLAAVWVGRTWNFAPFSDDPMGYVALPVSVLLLLSGFFAQPVVLKLMGWFWSGDDAPQEINYTQGWAQAVVVVPLMATGFFLAAILWGQSLNAEHALAAAVEFGDLFKGAWSYWPLPLSIAFASLWMLSLVSLRRYSVFGVLVALTAPIPTLFLLHALLAAIMLLLRRWAASPAEGQWLAFVWAPALVLYAFALAVNILIGMLGRQSSESVREWWSRLGAWLGIYGFAWMLMTLAGVYGPRLGLALFDGDTWTRVSTVAVWIGTTGAGLLAGNSAATNGQSKIGAPEKTTFQKVTGVVALVGPFVFMAGLLIGVSTLLHLIILNNSLEVLPGLDELRTGYWAYMNQSDPMVVFYVLLAMVGSVLLLAGRVDINEFSLNAFYRSRLTRCYLGATRYRPQERTAQNFTGFDEKDDLPVADLPGRGSKPSGPLHLINCALNLGGSSDLALHTRHSAPFTISPYAVGSSYMSSQSGIRIPIGYRRTAAYGGKEGQATVGQAISVSGAAASPNMGYHTSAVVAFLLTLFNVRLGWWFPNPRATASKSPSPWFSLRYLLKELFGGADDKSNFLMISDGGHFENLAAYELVRRKCRVIVISDAECDPDLHFSSLGSLIRMCEVDFGAKILLDLKSIRLKGDGGGSTQNFAVGGIQYLDGTQGVLIYLKASVTVDQDSAVLQVKAGHPAFPHESTGDQFYGEDQFESYRRLGREVAARAFAPAAARATTFVALATELETAARRG